MIYLPTELWSKIYEYDSTYVHCFNEVIDELNQQADANTQDDEDINLDDLENAVQGSSQSSSQSNGNAAGTPTNSDKVKGVLDRVYSD